jgi:hypothetical protein
MLISKRKAIYLILKHLLSSKLPVKAVEKEYEALKSQSLLTPF